MGQGRDLEGGRVSGAVGQQGRHAPINRAPASRPASRFVAAVPFPIGSSLDFIRCNGTRATGTVEVRRIGETVAMLSLRLADRSLVDVAAWGNQVTEFNRNASHLLASAPRVNEVRA